MTDTIEPECWRPLICRLVTADEWDAITAALEAARLAVGASGGIDWLAFVERLTALRTALNALDGKS